MNESPVPSASLILLRDAAPGLEVLLLVRRPDAKAFAGALVFPGGKLAAGDDDPALIDLCRGAGQLTDAERIHRIAAVRETFEECGLLLARSDDSEKLIDGQRALALAGYRPVLDRGEIGIAQFCRAERLELALDDLTPFARWITPPSRPPCFDTRFYLARAPADQQSAHDGAEALDSLWLTPGKGLERADSGELRLVLPTRMNLLRLASAADVDMALEQARGTPVVPIRPEIEAHPEGQVMRLPPASGYGAERVLLRRGDGRFVVLD